MPTRVVLIDLDEALLAACETLLSSRGFEVFTASDGRTGMQLVRDKRPDVLVLDLVLPKVHGLQIVGRVREDATLNHARVLVAPSRTYPLDVRRAEELGAMVFLKKPYTPDDLYEAVEYLLTIPALHGSASRRLESWHFGSAPDTDPAPIFDDLARLAALVCQSEGAIITLSEGEKQLLKARYGVPAATVGTDLPFSRYVLAQTDIFLVPDTSQDERFQKATNVATPPRLRFYAGLPLLSDEEMPIGTLAVIDREPRQLDNKQKEALRLLARQVQFALEHQRNGSRELALGAAGGY